MAIIDADSIQVDKTPTHVFNPLKTDVITYIRDEENVNVKYIVPSMELVTYPKYIADHLARDLETAIINARNVNPNDEEEITKIRKEILE